MLESWKLWGSMLASIFAGALSAYGFLEGYLQQRIVTAIEAHDEDRANAAHPRMRSRLDSLETKVDELRTAVPANTAQIEKAYKALYEMYWFRVGEKAVELERNRNLHSRTRAAVQRQFERLVSEGKPLDDAYRKALSMAAGLPGE